VYGWIKGQPTRIYYGVHVKEHRAHPGDAEQATVVSTERAPQVAGSLAYVADWIATGRYRVVAADDVPPEPVVRRIGHERWKEIVRVQVDGRTVWVGRVSGFTPMVLDAAGRIVRAKAVCERAVSELYAADHARYARK
jgi:hypothetical protein